eukprot:scaffold306837_cov48-Prasinocladus_malaysianus.AAC.1
MNGEHHGQVTAAMGLESTGRRPSARGEYYKQLRYGNRIPTMTWYDSTGYHNSLRSTAGVQDVQGNHVTCMPEV